LSRDDLIGVDIVGQDVGLAFDDGLHGGRVWPREGNCHRTRGHRTEGRGLRDGRGKA
jgi:hypothetical protein